LCRSLAAFEQLPHVDAVARRVLLEIGLDSLTIHAATSLFTGLPVVSVSAVASRGVDRVSDRVVSGSRRARGGRLRRSGSPILPRTPPAYPNRIRGGERNFANSPERATALGERFRERHRRAPPGLRAVRLRAAGRRHGLPLRAVARRLSELRHRGAGRL